jgi:glycosyltransferase involved in cell wall biosynthesis
MENKMKICMMAHTVYETDARVRSAVETFAQKGYAVDLICLRDPQQAGREVRDSLRIYRPVRMRKPSNIILYMLQLAWFTLVATWSTMILHLRNRYDLIYVHTIPDVLVFAGLVPQLLGAKVLLDMHEIMPELYMNRHHVTDRSLMLRVMIWLEKRSIGLADQVFVAAPFLVDKLHGRHQCRHKLSVIMNLPNPGYFTLPDRTRQRASRIFNMIYPGTLSELHGVDVALAALKMIKDETDWPIAFHIYGRGPQKEQLVSYAQEAGLDHVHFHDEVTVEELGHLLHTMDLGIVSKRSGVFAEDAVSTKLLEFAATGLPAVVSRTRGDMIFFDDSMFVFVEPGNARALADGIKTIYQDRRLYDSMADNLHRWAKDNLWEKQKQVYWSVIERLLHKRDNAHTSIHPAGMSDAVLESARTSLDQTI